MAINICTHKYTDIRSGLMFASTYLTCLLLDHIVFMGKSSCLVVQLCLTLCYPLNCSLPGSSVHGISQLRILEWVAIFFSKWSSQSRDQTCISWFSSIAGRFLTCWAIGKAHWEEYVYLNYDYSKCQLYASINKPFIMDLNMAKHIRVLQGSDSQGVNGPTASMSASEKCTLWSTPDLLSKDFWGWCPWLCPSR